jgi:hypothetical protein
MTERGRAALQKILEKFWEAPERLLEWNDNFQCELDRIQEAVDRLAATIEGHPELES